MTGRVKYNEKDIERFWDKVEKTDNCWLWCAFTNHDGYGKFGIGGRMVRAHRFSYEIAWGEIPQGLDVLHKCHNRACVNPSHLYAGTHQDNMVDRTNAGHVLSGERHNMVKLSWSDVNEIRQKYATGNFTQAELAEEYGVKQMAISNIVNGKRWIA